MQHTNIVNTPNGGQIIPNEALETYNSLYYLMKGKRDTDIKLYNDDKKINRSDIIELNQRIQDKLYTHKISSGLTTITVTLDNREVKDFGNWSTFENTQWHQSIVTHSVIIEWDANIILPNQFSTVPQAHTLRLRIGSGLRPNEFFQVVMTGAEDFEIGEAMSDMVCKIDFVNNNICNELKSIITEWYDALPKNTPSSIWIKRCNKHRGKIELFINFIFLSTIVFLLNILFKSLIPFINVQQNKDLLKWTFLSLSICFPLLYVCLKSSNFYSQRIIEKTISRFSSYPIIELTRGDTNKINSIKENNNKLLNDLKINILATLGLNILTWVVAQCLPYLVNTLVKLYLH